MGVLGLNRFWCGRGEWRWHWFEFAITLTAVMEVLLYFTLPRDGDSAGGGISVSLFRLVRFTRIGRVVRLCRLQIFRELMTMVDGAVYGIRTLLCAGVLVFLPIYSVALILRETAGSIVDGGPVAAAFGSVPIAFMTVFRSVVIGEDADSTGRPVFLRLAMRHSWVYGAIYVSSVMLMTFGLVNVIAAIYVDNVLSAYKFNDQLKMQKRLRDQYFFATKMAELIELLCETCPRLAEAQFGGSNRKHGSMRSADPSITLERAMAAEITRVDFDALCAQPRFACIMRDLDISAEDQHFLFDTLDANKSGTIELAELLVGTDKLRGEARRCDIVGLGIMTENLQQEIRSHVAEVTNALHGQQAILNDVKLTLSRLDIGMSTSANMSICQAPLSTM